MLAIENLNDGVENKKHRLLIEDGGCTINQKILDKLSGVQSAFCDSPSDLKSGYIESGTGYLFFATCTDEAYQKFIMYIKTAYPDIRMVIYTLQEAHMDIFIILGIVYLFGLVTGAIFAFAAVDGLNIDISGKEKNDAD